MTASAPTISYISGRMILGAEIDDGTGPEFVFHLPDALGSTRDVVDSSGNVIRSFEHDEYGNLISSWSSGTGAATPKTWIGGLSVNDDTADSGMFNMGHRNYAGGVLGRFISRDPIGHAGNLNLYAYTTNPVSFVDPSGLELEGDYHQHVADALKFAARPGYMDGINPEILKIAHKYLDEGQLYCGEIETVAQYERSRWGNEWITLNPQNARFYTWPDTERTLAAIKSRSLSKRDYNVAIARAYQIREATLAGLASALVHEATHAWLASCGREGDRKTDELIAYQNEVLFLANVLKRSTGARVRNGLVELINSAYRDAWSKEGVRISENFRPKP